MIDIDTAMIVIDTEIIVINPDTIVIDTEVTAIPLRVDMLSQHMKGIDTSVTEGVEPSKKLVVMVSISGLPPLLLIDVCGEDGQPPRMLLRLIQQPICREGPMP